MDGMTTKRSRRWSWLTGLLIAIFALSACGTGTAPGTDGGGSPQGTATGESPQSTSPGGTLGTMHIGSGSFGPQEYPMFAAMDALREEGYTIEYTQGVSGIDLLVEGVAQGEFDAGFTGFNTIVSAIELGAPLINVMDRNTNSWSLWATNEIETCEDLDGATVAIHSETASTGWMAKDYVALECPGTEPNYLVLPGSENRYAAMIAGEIDASPLELFDSINIRNEAGDRFHQLQDFYTVLPRLIVSSEFVNTDWAEENPDLLIAFIRENLEQHRLVWENPDYFRELDEKYRDVFGTEPMSDDAIEAYTRFFPVNGGLADEEVAFSLEWYERVELLPGGSEVDDVADRSYIDAALEEIGIEPGQR